MNATTLTNDQLKALETADLLDIEFDEIPDAPDFVNPPEGIYLVDLKISQGDYERKVYDNGEPTGETVDDFRFSVNCVIKDILDVQESALDDGESLPNIGDRFSNSYFGKQGLQGLVGDTRELAAALGVTKPRALLETLSENPVEAIVALKRTRRKGKDGQVFLGVKFESIQQNA